MSNHIRDMMKKDKEEKEDRYNTSNLTLSAKLHFYDKKYI